MKKILITLCMALSLATAARTSAQPAQIRTLITEFRGEPGVDVVDLGSVALGLLRATLRTQAENEQDQQAIDLLRSIKRLTILDCSGAAQNVKDRFFRKAKRALEDQEMLMEAKDGDETVRVFGQSSSDGNILQDIFILADDTLISIKGTIRMDQVNALIGTAKAQ
jgi:hypothetical protein